MVDMVHQSEFSHTQRWTADVPKIYTGVLIRAFPVYSNFHLSEFFSAFFSRFAFGFIFILPPSRMHGHICNI